MQFGTNLKKVRKTKKISQDQLAMEVGVSRQAIASYEAGRREPCFEVLLKLADFFNVSTDYLLGRQHYSTFLHLGNIKKNIAELIKGKELNEFLKDVGLKTGILIPSEKFELYLNGKATPDSTTVKVLALYAGVSVDFFYKNNL